MAQMATAVFGNREEARRAIHALRDHGVDEDCISVLAVADDGSGRVTDLDRGDKTDAPGKDDGISTTTPEDAGKGAAEGAAIGAGLGIAAALISLFIPGIGLVTGGGALATALGGAAGATAAGAVAGGVTGFLSDMGMPADAARDYEAALKRGGILVSVHDADDADQGEIRQILQKYGGGQSGVYSYSGPIRIAQDPDRLDATNPRLTDDATDETLNARGVRGDDLADDMDDDFDAVAGTEGSASGRLDNRDVGLR